MMLSNRQQDICDRVRGTMIDSILKIVAQNPFVTALGLLAVATGIRFMKSNKKIAKEAGRLRSLSFSSEILVDGAFPPAAKANQAVVNVMFYVNNCPPEESIRTRIRHMIAFDRFRATARRESARWQLYDLGIENEVERQVVETYELENEDAIRAKVDELCVSHIAYDSERPLWRCIRLVNKSGGKSAILFRVHHVIGDGIAMVGMMTKVFDKANGDPFTLDIPEKIGGGSKLGFGLDTMWRFLKSLVEVLSVAISKHDTDTAFAPGHSTEYFYKHKSTQRKTIYFPSVSLEFVKELKNKAKVTINDVLMSATSGALRRYSHVKKDGKVPTLDASTDIQTRALVAVAFPRPTKDLQNKTKAMRNLFSMISIPMTVNETNALDRLNACAAVTTEAKNSPAAIIQLLLQNYVLSLAPRFLQQQTAFDAFSRHSLVFSNVPGPADYISLCGEKLLSVHVIFPNLIPQVILISYAGGVYFTLSADPDEVDAKVLPGLYIEELKEMAAKLGVNSENMLYNPSH